MAAKGDETVPRPKTEPPTRSVRVDEECYDALMMLAAMYRKSAPQFLTEIIRPILIFILKAHGIDFPIQAKPEAIPDALKQAMAKPKPKAEK